MVPPENFTNLTISGSRGSNSVTLSSSGSIGLAGTLTGSATFGSGGYVITGSTVDFNGAGTQTIPAFNFNNLTSSSTGARTLSSTGTIGIAGTFTQGTNAYTITGSTVSYNGTGAQTVAGSTYHNLILATSGTKTFGSGTTSIGGNLTLSGTATGDATTNLSTINYNASGAQAIANIQYYHLSLNGSGTKTFAAGTSYINGNFTLGGTATADATTNATTINYSGSGGQAIANITYNNLTLSNAGTKSFTTGTTAIHGTLTMAGSAAADAVTNSALIDYNGTGAQGIAAITYYDLSLSTSGTKTFTSGTTSVSHTLAIGGSATADATTNSTTISYGGSGSQNIAALVYYNLALGNAGTKTFPSGTTSLQGSLTVSGSAVADAVTNTSTINYSGTGSQTIGAMNYYNLTSSSSGARTLASSGTIGIAGAFTPGTNAYTTTGSTISFNGTGGQSVPLFTFNNLSFGGSGAKSAAGTLSVGGNFTNPDTVVMGTYTLSVTGTKTNTGLIRFAGASNGLPFTGGTVEYNGTVSQTVTTGTYNNLLFTSTGIKHPAAGVIANGNVTIGTGATLQVTGGVTMQIIGNVINQGTLQNAGILTN